MSPHDRPHTTGPTRQAVMIHHEQMGSSSRLFSLSQARQLGIVVETRTPKADAAQRQRRTRAGASFTRHMKEARALEADETSGGVYASASASAQKSS